MVVAQARAYLRVAVTELRNLAHFRANLLAWALYTPLQMGILYLLWRIVYAHTDRVGGFGFDDMMLYYVVVHFLRRVIEPAQSVNYQVWSEINEGKLDIYLARPLSFGLFTFSRSLGTPLVELVIGVPCLIVLSLVLGLPLQTDPGVLAAFLLSLAAGYAILFLVQFLIGSLTFWFERIFGIRDMIFSVFILFSGQLIPISVLPGWVETVSHYLPFEGIFYIPAALYARHELDLTSLALLARQLVWIVVLLVVAATVWSRGSLRYASQGG